MIEKAIKQMEKNIKMLTQQMKKHQEDNRLYRNNIVELAKHRSINVVAKVKPLQTNAWEQGTTKQNINNSQANKKKKRKR